MALQCLYQSSAGELAAAIARGGFSDDLEKRFREVFWERPDKREVRSWANSIPTVVHLLVEAGLGDVQVLLELKAPITDVRMDMVLVGTFPQTDLMSVVVVENKQWRWVRPDAGMVRLSDDGAPQLHPANQVWGYLQVLRGYVSTLRDEKLCGIVNLHNAPALMVHAVRPKVQGLEDVVQRWVELYGAGEHRQELKDLLRRRLSGEQAAQQAEILLQAPVRPAEGLMARVSQCVRERTVFPLLEEQREAYDYVRRSVALSRQGAPKEVVVIVGGPGTGKSVIAVELLGTLTRQRVHAIHATGSRSFTRTLWRYAGLSGNQRGAFTYFNTFSDATPGDIEVIIADEAHRIRKTSRDRMDEDDLRDPPPQIDELIRAARVPVFLLDEHQVVRRGEVGSLELIRNRAEQLGCTMRVINLRHQFRCSGSPEYVDWVERLLMLAPSQGRPIWQPLENFTLYVAHTPLAMENYLRARVAENYKARIAAGFCWPWSKPNPDGTLPDDVVIGDWRRPWNSRADEYIKGIPPSWLWATDPAGFGQIGCIYSAQGFEYDYAGVIIGRDLVWRNGWRAERRYNRDPDQINADDFYTVIRNTYRVLATRGMRGAVLHSVDPATNQLLIDLGVPVLER
ncbi:hypothetical protein HNP84_000531 [Thermocatellispora tengchongensis]|uniref:AAA+ ATPase domain-containing protein n=1 Tax=Thermocatellispora tengchongensis TaxID=1073253 RepID=A0A840NYR2_9ACTN|nr:DUF2075 domain-containing protein [Thermocatellispora tengchongensis]MBB5130843.1 hypothetical protein [Thermocatellispora tengchongensis]